MSIDNIILAAQVAVLLACVPLCGYAIYQLTIGEYA